MGFSVIEEAVRVRIVEHFSDLLTDGLVVKGELDKLYDNMLTTDADLGCLIEYGGGSPQSRPPFKEDVWVWTIAGFFLLRYKGDDAQMEAQVRVVIDRLRSVFKGHHTLGGVTSKASLASMDTPDPGMINDTVFYWLFFAAEAFDKEE